MVIDDEGTVYVAGLCGPRFGALGSSKQHRPVAEGTGAEMFLLRLNPDLSDILWSVRIPDNAGYSPKLKLIEGGLISLVGSHGYHFDAGGEVKHQAELIQTEEFVRGIDHSSFVSAHGGDRRTKTGWEPWRIPNLDIFNPDRSRRTTLYHVAARIVGTNYSRLVSDSSFRVTQFDNEGMLLAAAWSDGGNTVLERLPYDLDTPVAGYLQEKFGKRRGLSFSTWGASVGSFCHIMRIDPATGEPLAKTLFVAYLADTNKPNGVRASDLAALTDNSVALIGGSAFGLIQTGQKLNTLSLAAGDYIGGKFLTILAPHLDDIRFSSALPGAGQVAFARHGANRTSGIDVTSRLVHGELRVAAVSGASFSDKFLPKTQRKRNLAGACLMAWWRF